MEALFGAQRCFAVEQPTPACQGGRNGVSKATAIDCLLLKRAFDTPNRQAASGREQSATASPLSSVSLSLLVEQQLGTPRARLSVAALIASWKRLDEGGDVVIRRNAHQERDTAITTKSKKILVMNDARSSGFLISTMGNSSCEIIDKHKIFVEKQSIIIFLIFFLKKELLFHINLVI